MPASPAPFLVHADASCLVVVKPAGQLAVPGRGKLSAGSLAEAVQAHWPDARVVHRLDMATSGLLLFACGADWQRHYGALFATRRIDKRYVALVRGRLGATVGSRGEIDLPLAADWPNRPRQQVDPVHGKASLTRWEVLEHDPDGRWTRLALQPVTGRSHQLRVHLMALGHPILGDALYQPDTAAQEAPRLMLHAEALCFQHPIDGRELRLQAQAPF